MWVIHTTYLSARCRQVAAYCLLACAALYMLGGLLCLSILRKARYRKQAERLRVEADLEALERQQEELRAVLASFSKD